MSGAHDGEPGADTSFDEAWTAHRGRLLGLAYRMLGSVADAEDVVQDAFVRFDDHRDAVEDPIGWLVTTTTRLCLDHLKSADVARRAYVGPWLPEPVVEPIDGATPEDRVTLDESVQMALLVALQELTPAERTALILHDVYQVPFEELARIVGRTPDACRQLASRARQRVRADGPPRFAVSGDVARRLANEFARTCRSGDVEGLARILDPEAVGLFDSGGAIPGAPLTPLVGGELIARTLVATVSGRGAGFTVASVNGDPGVVISVGPTVAAVVSLAVSDDRIIDVHAVGNPAKLRGVRTA